MNHWPAWQHDTLVQTLYSGRCETKNALYFDYALAQARADVFFSLLFGGRIVCSAGTFFDSPLAIRVFGEVFSDPCFKSLCEHHRWYPLRLNTDNPARWTPKQYVINRLSDPNLTLGLFREDQAGFEPRSSRTIAELKAAAADCIANEHFDRLRNIYEPFLVDYVVPPYNELLNTDKEGAPETQTRLGDQRTTSVRIPPLLTGNFAVWLHSILDYLSLPGCFVSMDSDTYKNQLTKFSPLSAIKRRTDGLIHDRIGNYDLDELQERNCEFEHVIGNTPTMNAFLRKGPGIYGHYYALINHWVEVDWHTTRHAAYASSACLLSSNWEARQVFDFDAKSKVHYLMDTRIDDSLRMTQERFGELDWSILFDLVSDQNWRSLIWNIRDAGTAEEVAAVSDEILALLSRHITSFTFHRDKGKLSILAKNVASVATHASAAVVCTSHFESTLDCLLGIAGSAAALSNVASLNKPIATAISDLVPGMRYLHRRFTNQQLRKAVVPRIYLPAFPN